MDRQRLQNSAKQAIIKMIAVECCILKLGSKDDPQNLKLFDTLVDKLAIMEDARKLTGILNKDNYV